ncbi:hypothetical protein RhiXN_01268 [Rhizoctonia solani]|uniref:Uncharacterized protein n=1 Tax=Rhizoctonia solani TaxID=456999 RepID=A0A8H8P8D9_9AGAM|nr:uncharacterized protein RhiXN_01268 [Rhizoctonia solani]QRW26673.1 hypothetical protein RhiXN_01268 [Rhizoctonia solani]
MTSQNPIDVDSMVGQSKCPICHEMKDSMFSFLCGHIVWETRYAQGSVTGEMPDLYERTGESNPAPDFLSGVAAHVTSSSERGGEAVEGGFAERSRVIEELGKEIKQNSKSLAEINAHIDQLAKMRGKLTGEHRETTP